MRCIQKVELRANRALKSKSGKVFIFNFDGTNAILYFLANKDFVIIIENKIHSNPPKSL